MPASLILQTAAPFTNPAGGLESIGPLTYTGTIIPFNQAIVLASGLNTIAVTVAGVRNTARRHGLAASNGRCDGSLQGSVGRHRHLHSADERHAFPAVLRPGQPAHEHLLLFTASAISSPTTLWWF